jgi:hypothetical protein
MDECNVLFCVLDRHDDMRHVDASGHTFTEITPDMPVMARCYTW